MQHLLQGSIRCGRRQFTFSLTSRHARVASNAIRMTAHVTDEKPSKIIRNPLDSFTRRHLGSSDTEIDAMLKVVGASKVEEVAARALPRSIKLKTPLTLPNDSPAGERSTLDRLAKIMSKNAIMKTYIGTGYYDTITPPVIKRNLIENPLWYTPYTPYQAELAQGRLESLLNFQQMVVDLTGMKFSNASLLDESTACAEAMTFCVGCSKKAKKGESPVFFVSEDCHPQNIGVVKTRAEALGIQVVVGDHRSFDASNGAVVGALLQYPATDGSVVDYAPFIEHLHDNDALAVVATDLLASCLLKPPGEFGADVAVGSSQRFGVPLGYGGPHAGFFAIRDLKQMRRVPGRVVGVSLDSDGNKAYRLALQPREQHIKREKATSNICTAQALLANVAAMFAVYHGPTGLRNISEKTHTLTVALSSGLKSMGFDVPNESFFDTVRVDNVDAEAIAEAARKAGSNFRILSNSSICMSLDETTTVRHVEGLFDVFKPFGKGTPPAIEALVDDPEGDTTDMSFFRTSHYLTHPVFNSHHTELEMQRYMHKLVQKDISLSHSMIPLGSCTMKLNAAVEMEPISWPSVNSIHPFVPLDQAQGYKEMIDDLRDMLVRVTGLDDVSFQPNSGASGEYAGLRCISAYHASRGESNRKVVIIPDSAHGTNPASATLAGLRTVVVKSTSNGYVSLEELQKKLDKHQHELAGIMITYPSTFGIFEEHIKEICERVHKAGGQVYLDGANLNALVGLASLGDIGADVCHMNLHKTFCIPHGGGGPGMGPIGVKKHLAPFLPTHPLVACNESPSALGPMAAAPFSSASILPITWMYLRMMGAEGLAKASQLAILNANYMKERLKGHYSVRYTSPDGHVAHEFIVDFSPFKKFGVEVEDVAKRLMDYNFHSPTMSWPVPGTLMIEPTESESKQELDRFCDAMISIRMEIRQIEEGQQPKDNNVLVNAPHTMAAVCSDTWDRPYSREDAAFPLPYVKSSKFWPSVSRIDNVYGDLNVMCTCPPIEAYLEKE